MKYIAETRRHYPKIEDFEDPRGVRCENLFTFLEDRNRSSDVDGGMLPRGVKHFRCAWGLFRAKREGKKESENEKEETFVNPDLLI